MTHSHNESRSWLTHTMRTGHDSLSQWEPVMTHSHHESRSWLTLTMKAGHGSLSQWEPVMAHSHHESRSWLTLTMRAGHDSLSQWEPVMTHSHHESRSWLGHEPRLTWFQAQSSTTELSCYSNLLSSAEPKRACTRSILVYYPTTPLSHPTIPYYVYTLLWLFRSLTKLTI